MSRVRIGMVAGLIVAVSCSSAKPTAGLHVSGGRAEVGTAVFVNHRMVGRLGKEWWVTSSPLDTVATKDGRSALVSYGRTRPDSDYTAVLNAMVRPSGRARLVFVAPSGAKLETVCELGESTDVDISFAGHLVRVVPQRRPRIPPPSAVEESDSTDD